MENNKNGFRYISMTYIEKCTFNVGIVAMAQWAQVGNYEGLIGRLTELCREGHAHGAMADR
jgi:hypothetical protein